jgi:hypothetical protein
MTYPVTMRQRVRDLDTVKFLKAVGEWPAGTVGVVIAEEPRSALVEVVTEDQVDDEGFPLRDLLDDLVHVDYTDLEVLDSVRGQ